MKELKTKTYQDGFIEIIDINSQSLIDVIKELQEKVNRLEIYCDPKCGIYLKQIEQLQEKVKSLEEWQKKSHIEATEFAHTIMEKITVIEQWKQNLLKWNEFNEGFQNIPRILKD